jgi:phytoene synthase
MSELEKEAIQTIALGSKSFALASKFFPHELQMGAAMVYMWCRYCDDEIDKIQKNTAVLERLLQKTSDIYQNPSLVVEHPFVALKEVVVKYKIPAVYPLDLLAGMKMDLEDFKYHTLEQLLLYCYRVASTVGIMMSYVMGLFRIEALEEAAHLGIAMQLSNISRDVKEDYVMGRTYLPINWLTDAGLTRENYMELKNRDKLFSVIMRLIAKSEEYYHRGLSGVGALSWRSALTILIAGKMYREIGREILRRGPLAIDRRTVVPTWRKVFLIFFSLWEMLLSIPGRLVFNRRPVEINKLWRLT